MYRDVLFAFGTSLIVRRFIQLALGEGEGDIAGEFPTFPPAPPVVAGLVPPAPPVADGLVPPAPPVVAGLLPPVFGETEGLTDPETVHPASIATIARIEIKTANFFFIRYSS